MEIPFDGILTLLIFLVGIPALVLQLISAAERRAALKKEGLDVRSSLIVALIVIALGLIAQFSYSYFSNDSDARKSLVQQAIWLGTFIPLIILVLAVAKRIPEQYGRRERIIKNLTQDVLKDMHIRGRIGGGTFNDLADLGKQCDPGQEREMVIEAFRDICKIMLKEQSYKGDSFEVLIDELVHVLASNPEPKDLRNYDTAIKTLSAILSADGHLETDDDKQRAVHAISKLGRTLIIHFKSVERDNIILDYIDTLEFALSKKAMLTEVSQALFEIGICAVEENQDFIVVAAVDKMTTLAESFPFLPNEFVADMLGLLAHFWAKSGSRREFAEAKLCEVEKFLSRDRISALEGAKIHCKQTMYFDVADELAQMMEISRGTKKPRKKK
jgi:hypothetical protein